MARRRRKKSTRRRDTSVKLLNVAEAYAYSNIMTTNLFGASVPEFITGKQNISQAGSTYNLAAWSSGSTSDAAIEKSLGVGTVSIRDLAHNPQLALDATAIRLKANMWNIVGQTVATRWGFKFGKRLLRQPINMINRSVFKPLAMGIKL